MDVSATESTLPYRCGLFFGLKTEEKHGPLRRPTDPFAIVLFLVVVFVVVGTEKNLFLLLFAQCALQLVLLLLFSSKTKKSSRFNDDV